MRIIFVRHGEPDYSTDTLTEQGQREAAALKERAKHWEIEQAFVSPMGRAKETAQPTLDALGIEAACYEWMEEFRPRIIDPLTMEEHCAWDLMPETYTADPLLMDPDHWFDAEVYQQNPKVKERALHIYEKLDQFIEGYGYHRHIDEATGADCHYYDFVDPTGHVNPAEAADIMLHGTANYVNRDTDDERTIVIFCHLGITCVMAGHLMGVSPVSLWHNTCIPPTGVTVLNAEKRLHNTAHFRMQTLGDTSHLYAAGVARSGYASFASVFQG